MQMTLDVKVIAQQTGASVAEHPTGNYSALFISSGLVEFALQVRRSVLEDAAKQCESLAVTDCDDSNITRHECAAAIRSLK